ncbi:unnamed protein product [Prorocentrum cordatum]|uniref:Reverse transcriptase Ty1/copia-type domain-containing protein n=1 Tax=Prorocentrum cordatum TaxID=2364126 RepID=A0ABN9U2W9_9DINO|nr:unnamed protein product [Polarella glacialis]
MVVNDEDILRLAKPPSVSGRGHWAEWSFVLRSCMMVQADDVATLIEAAEATAEPDLSMTTIERALGARGNLTAKKIFHMLVMTVKGPGLGILRGNSQQDGHLRGNTFNEYMKKALHVDKAPATVKMSLLVQNLDDFATVKSATLQFLQSTHNAAGAPIPQNRRRTSGGQQRDPSAMEVDAVTRKGKDRKGKDTGLKGGQGKAKGKADDTINLRAAWIRDAECWICSKKGNLQELTYAIYEEYEASYIFAVTEWAGTTNYVAKITEQDPNLEAANGHHIKHYGDRTVKMKLKDGRSVVITVQVCDVKGPILSAGKFCATNVARGAHFDLYGGVLTHELAGEVKVDRVKNHYSLKCWVEAPEAGVQRVEAEVVPVRTLAGPKLPSKEEIEMHNLLHDPPMPWCDICVQAKGIDACHPERHQAANASHPVRLRVAATAFINQVKTRIAGMETPPCEVIVQTSKRNSHHSNGGAESMVATIRNQVKAYKIQIEKLSSLRIRPNSKLLAWLPARQYARFHKSANSGMAPCEEIRMVPYINTVLMPDEHLIGTPNGLVRSRALKRRVEDKRWDTALLEPMKWDPWFATSTIRGRGWRRQSLHQGLQQAQRPRDTRSRHATTRGFDQTLQGNEVSYSATTANSHLKMMFVDAARKGHVAAIGECSGAFYQAPLDAEGTGEKVYIEPPPEAGLPPDMVWEAVSVFPGLKGSPKAWDAHSSKLRTEDMQMKQSHYDGCIFFKIEGDFDQKAGRHIDDFLITGPMEQVNSFLEEAKAKLNMQDAVELVEDGDEGRLLALNIRKVTDGFTLQGNPLLITDMAKLSGMENEKTSEVPETSNAKKQQDDEEELSAHDAVLYRSCVGKAMYPSHQRPDIQHVVNKLSTQMKTPPMKGWRMLKKLVRYLLGIREVHQLLVPRGGADSLKAYTDSDWADDPYTRAQKTPALSSAEAELYAIGSGAIETLGAETLMREWGYGDGVLALMTDSSFALAVAKKRGPGRMKHVELKMLAVQDWIKQKRLRIANVAIDATPADLLTEALAKQNLLKHGWELGLRGGPFGTLSWREAATGRP